MTLRSRALPLLLLFACGAAAPLAATTYVPMSDAALTDQATLVVVAEITDRSNAPVSGEPATDYQIQVERELKGFAPGSALVVRVPGGVAPGGIAWRVFGAPSFVVGDRVLLFLSPRTDGTYDIVQLLLGAFHEAPGGGRDLAVRDLSEALRIVPPGTTSTSEELRDFGRFAQWIADRAAGLDRRPDYLVATAAPSISSLTRPFTLWPQCGDALPLRWFVFDGGGTVGWKALSSGVAGMPGGGFSEFQQALAAWTNDPGSGIGYVYAGQTASSSGSNTILFDDPNNEIAKSFDCSKGGVLAVGGPTYSCATVGTYNGNDYHPIGGGHIATQDGAGCFFAANGGANGAEVFAHELGHTLGLQHSSVSGALMRAYAYGDGRGASLGSDDRAAVECLYGDSATCAAAPPPASPPSSPSGLTATPLSTTKIRLRWSDNSSNEEEFRVDLDGGGGFSYIGSVGAGVVGVDIGNLQPATAYSFRVRACNGSGCSAYSNVASATTDEAPSSSTQPPVAPANLEGIGTSTSTIDLTWQDLATNEQEFQLEQDEAGTFVRIRSLPADTTEAVVSGLEVDTAYTFRVRACNGSGCSAYSNEATARTEAKPGIPVPAAPTNLTATAVSSTEIDLAWEDHAGDQTGFRVESRKQGAASYTEIAVLPGSTTGLQVTDLEAATQYRFRVRATGAGGLSGYSNGAVATTLDDPCPDDPTILCLDQGRFLVHVDWTNQHDGGSTGVGHAIPSTDRTGFFWFFDPGNTELLVKVLDGSLINGNFWVFYGALSDVEYDLTVDDALTGQTKTYHNTPGDLCGRGDILAFPATSSTDLAGAATVAWPAPAVAPFVPPTLEAVTGTAPASASCTPDDSTLCLDGGRFSVHVDWTTSKGASGSGHPLPGTSQTGYFWFFSPDNLELAVKLLDGRDLNGMFWVFYGALSDVEYDIVVTDTVTGRSRSYHNDSGNLCGRGDTSALAGS